MTINTIVEAGQRVLNTADAREKAQVSCDLAAYVFKRDLIFGEALSLPERPARPEAPDLLPPGQMPKRRGGSLSSRLALLHALAHIELNAIDLAWDAALRFGADQERQFALDWVSVGADEGRHFLMLADRLESLSSFYGALPAHDGLWQAAYDTRHDLAGRLSVVPLVLEARALDVSPTTIERLHKQGDSESADILKIIYEDEIEHVAIGAKWFQHLCKVRGAEPEQLFKRSLERYFARKPKGPFNVEARARAGMERRLYDWV